MIKISQLANAQVNILQNQTDGVVKRFLMKLLSDRGATSLSNLDPRYYRGYALTLNALIRKGEGHTDYLIPLPPAPRIRVYFKGLIYYRDERGALVGLYNPLNGATRWHGPLKLKTK